MEVFVWLALETALLANPGSWLSDDIRVFVGRTCNMAWVFLRSSFPFLMLSRKKLKLRYIYVHKYTGLSWPMITYFQSILLSWIPFRIDAGALRRVDILVGGDRISIFIFRQNRDWVHIGAQWFILGKVVYNS